MREMGSIPGSGRSPRGRHGNPLQYSCLKNPMDRGAWWAIVHGTVKSQTRLSDWAHIPSFGHGCRNGEAPFIPTKCCMWADCLPSGSWGQQVSFAAALIQWPRVPCPHLHFCISLRVWAKSRCSFHLEKYEYCVVFHEEPVAMPWAAHPPPHHRNSGCVGNSFVNSSNDGDVTFFKKSIKCLL